MAVESDRVVHVAFNDDTLVLRLADGCVLTVALTWFPRLLEANTDARRNWKVSNGGHAVHWPDVDEAVNVAHLLRRRKDAAGPTL